MEEIQEQPVKFLSACYSLQPGSSKCLHHEEGHEKERTEREGSRVSCGQTPGLQTLRIN